jgi:hypothetical protein
MPRRRTEAPVGGLWDLDTCRNGALWQVCKCSKVSFNINLFRTVKTTCTLNSLDFDTRCRGNEIL